MIILLKIVYSLAKETVIILLKIVYSLAKETVIILLKIVYSLAKETVIILFQLSASCMATSPSSVFSELVAGSNPVHLPP